jgi:hypothetical protein
VRKSVRVRLWSPLERDHGGAILPRSDWSVSLSAERKGGTKVKFALSLHCPVSTIQRMPSKNTVRKGTRQSRRVSHFAGGFAVLRSARWAVDFDLDQSARVRSYDGIMSRVLRKQGADSDQSWVDYLAGSRLFACFRISRSLEF